MNKQQCDILNTLISEPFINQRILAELSGHSLGIVNRCLKELIADGYITESITLTQKATDEYRSKAPENAIILAAGYGMRMVPINNETPKGLLEVNGERLIDRLIRQLREVGIKEIYVVVGFMKEKFEYLIDTYGVELIVNPEYSKKNNLHSMKLVSEHLSNTYVIPCDIWCDQNPFRQHELYSWYMVSEIIDSESDVRVNRKAELVRVPERVDGNTMIGISYLVRSDAEKVRDKIAELSKDPENDNAFWEEALYCHTSYKEQMIVNARVVHSSDFVEINTYEQLRELDSDSNQLKSDAIAVICKTLNAESRDIANITVLKKGMTNRSFLFSCNGKKYIMRIPGEGTDKLINRSQEADAYRAVAGLGICDNVIYMNPENGYKITEYFENARVCDPQSTADLAKCMKKLRSLHGGAISVGHEFDIWSMIDFYEDLWDGNPSIYRDYKTTKENVLSLKGYIDRQDIQQALTHIDAVPDNFLFFEDENGNEEIRLIDWEYAGMQDPHVDIAMFCIYSLYNKKQIDRLINIYFEGSCSEESRTKIYVYIAACGLLWSNWCEYKSRLGVEFGEYSLRQYRFAKDYYRYSAERINKEDEKNA